MGSHGFSSRKGDKTPLGQFVPFGKFGRLFPKLPALFPNPEDREVREKLTELGNAMVDADPNSEIGDNPGVPAGFTYLGQFIDHDITFDPTTLSEKKVDPLALTNFRTPALDLDSIYGAGPEDQPYLYQFEADPNSPGRIIKDKFLIGDTTESGTGRENEALPIMPNDLPRAPKTSVALIGDPRNDENLIVAQTHLAFLKFHNKIVDGLNDGSIPRQSPINKTLFEEARELVVWHYQWIVLNDFLRRVIDPQELDRVLTSGRTFYKFREFPFIPVEFSVAAYRLGHSMIRSEYDYNRVFTFANFPNPPQDSRLTSATLQLLFEFTAKSGTQTTTFPGLNPTLPSNWIIDWRRFFEVEPEKIKVGLSRKLDPFLVDPLANLPNVPPPGSLAVRNLLRGASLGLPSGQRIARRLGLDPLPPEKIAEGPDGAKAKELGFDKETPLWYYILKEADVQAEGKHLGAVGSRILAEVFVGLLEGDSNSFLATDRQWKPTLKSATPGTFTFVDLLNFVADINPIGD